jgi:hypothetical protein
VLGVALTANAAFAQAILGKVTAADDRAPLVGAIVTLLDDRGATVKAVLTSTAGTATFRDTPAGRYRLQAAMIGRQTVETELFDVAGDLTVREIALTHQPIALEGLEVSATPVCSLDATHAMAAYQVWDEARKALLAAQLTATAGVYRFELARTHQLVDPLTRRVIAESTDFDLQVRADPWQSLSAESIEEAGYVRAEGTSQRLYGPNTDVFLSEGFQRTHCFSLRRDDARTGLIGLSFSVAPDRKVSDIEGTLWIDQASAELRSLEFLYKNLPASFGVRDHGGEMTYFKLDSGMWAIRSWKLFGTTRQEAAEVRRVDRQMPPPLR